MGKALSTIVILSISVMMISSILPAYAPHAPPGICGGPNWNPVTIEFANNEIADIGDNKDRNGNHWVCFMETNSGKKLFRDDRVPNN